MNLRDFIPHVLEEIVTGVKSAQEKLGKDTVPSDSVFIDDIGSIQRRLVGDAYRFVQTVKFDVAVSVERETGGKVSLNVLGLNVGGEGGVQKKNEQVSRVQFEIVLALPAK